MQHGAALGLERLEAAALLCESAANSDLPKLGSVASLAPRASDPAMCALHAQQPCNGGLHSWRMPAPRPQ
jgi:hypothetical protein